MVAGLYSKVDLTIVTYEFFPKKTTTPIEGPVDDSIVDLDIEDKQDTADDATF